MSDTTKAVGWVERAMLLSRDAADAAWDAGSVGLYERMWIPLADKRNSKHAELRTHLTTQAAITERLAKSLKRLAEEAGHVLEVEGHYFLDEDVAEALEAHAAYIAHQKGTT